MVHYIIHMGQWISILDVDFVDHLVVNTDPPRPVLLWRQKDRQGACDETFPNQFIVQELLELPSHFLVLQGRVLVSSPIQNQISHNEVDFMLDLTLRGKFLWQLTFHDIWIFMKHVFKTNYNLLFVFFRRLDHSYHNQDTMSNLMHNSIKVLWV